MATQQVQAAEDVGYIDTSRYERIEGQLVERPLPNRRHSEVQFNVTLLLKLDDGTLEAGAITVSMADILRHEE